MAIGKLTAMITTLMKELNHMLILLMAPAKPANRDLLCFSITFPEVDNREQVTVVQNTTLPSGAPCPSTHRADIAMRPVHGDDPVTTLTSNQGATKEQTKPMIFKLGPADYQLAINKSFAQTRQGHMMVFFLH